MVLHPASGPRLRMRPVASSRWRSGSLRLPAHEATTAQLGAAYPFAASVRLPVEHVLIGRDLAGGPFAHDPFDLYRHGVLTNPNITVLGQIGRGKSAFVKTYLYRQAAFGRRIAVLDPKGEYRALAQALGTAPIKLSPRGGTRLNPLDGAGTSKTVAGTDAGEVRRQRLALVAALAEATLHRRLSPAERFAAEVALDSATSLHGGRSPALGELVELLLEPRAGLAGAVGTGTRSLAEDGRDVGLELRRLVKGDLLGMFDGETSPSVARGGGALVVDLSDVYHSEALPALMVCAAAWLQSMTSGRPAGAAPAAKTVFVVDEAWAVLSEVSVGRYLRSSWKLARAKGLANIAVCHRPSDLASVGRSGSEESRLAEGLLADSETVVCYAQPASELPRMAALLGCDAREIAYLPRLGRGVALWRVGDRRFLVEHLLGSHEQAMVYTDERLVDSDERLEDEASQS